ncbi:hypothetical protein IJ579_00085 [bacterium]|nr:hypothetical protein [bacterium]
MVAIMGINVQNRQQEASKLQDFLTKYGCFIRTRIGLHPMDEYKCLNYGIILIEVVDKINEIYDELSKNWQVQIMKF